jgi:hypothetical protein
MGFIRFFKSLVNHKVLGEEIIDSIEKSYYKFGKQMEGEDIHYILANVWLKRRMLHGEKVYNEFGQTVAMNETYLFACVPPPMCAKAFGIYMIKKEAPQVLEKHPEFLGDYNKIMAPVMKALDDGTIDLLYRKYNPTLAAVFDRNENE